MAETTEAKPFRREIDLGDGSGIQVFEGDTWEELADAMAQAQANATRKIREQNTELQQLRHAELAQAEEELEPDEPIEQAKPRALTAQERFDLARDSKDPDKAQDAWDRAFEARTGMKPEKFSEKATKDELNRRQAAAMRETTAFLAETPEYIECEENKLRMVGFMTKQKTADGRKAAWTLNNLRIAYRKLKAAGLLRLAGGNGNGTNGDGARPAADSAGAANPAPGAGADGAPADSGVTRTRPRGAISTTIPPAPRRAPAPASSKKPTQQEIDAMSLEEYNRFIAVPENLAYVNSLKW